MDKPLPAYSGTEPYVFVCYAHSDADKVYPDLIELNNQGINVWYDEGISGGKSWRAEIAEAIAGTDKVIFFISGKSLTSAHCLREVDYALKLDIEIVPVYLDDSSLPGELDLVLNRVQALFRETDSRYMEHLLGAIRKGTKTAPLGIAPKPRRRAWLSWTAAAAAALALVAWWQWDAPLTGNVSATGPAGAPSAYSVYLDGLELMERWDKDDNLDKAIEMFRQACELEPDFALAFARLGEGLRIRYALTRDEAWLDEAAASVDEAVRLNADLAPVQVAMGRIHSTRGNFDLALNALQRALAIDPNDAVANQVIATIYERLGRLEDAEAAFRKSLSLDPERIATLDSYANFLFRQSRFDEAARHWQAVVSLAPDNYAALVNLGGALIETDRISEAITVYERANEIKPTYMAYSNLGTAYGRAQRFPEAVEAYQRAIEIDGSDWLAYGNLAQTYSQMEGMDQQAAATYTQAIELAEEARQQDPRDAFAPSDLAIYYARIGQNELAQQRLETATTLAPNSAEIVAAAAEAYEIMGERDLAVEFALQSLELGFSRRRLLRNPDLADLMADPRIQVSP
jgi:tetratricopeptide (TPR) repeat protein